MSEDNNGNIRLSSGAIKSLESEKITTGAKKTIDVDYTFQIERATKNNGVYNCSLVDNDSKYGGFLLQYEPKDGTPGVGDIIHVSKIIIAILPSRDSHIYYCKNVKLIRRAMALQVDPNKISNLSKKKSLENYKNSVYKAQEDNKLEENNNNNNKSYGNFDDSGCSLISSLTTFTNNSRLYLKCKMKNPLKNFITKATKKDCTLQNYIFSDIKGDEIQATCFGKTAENLDKRIQEGGIYEIKKAIIQLADRAYNPTKCDYRLLFNDFCQIEPAPDNGKFGGVKFSIIPLEQIYDFPIGKLVDVFGFILDDRGFQEFEKNNRTIKNQRIIIGDDTLFKIELTLWEPIGNPDNNFNLGDLVAVKNCRIREFNGKKILSTTDSSELRNTLDSNSDKRLREFFNNHNNSNEYKDIQGESVFIGNRSPAELAFIKDVQKTFNEEMDNKDRPIFEIIGVVTKFNHSERNYYIGCAKCHKKMETDVCPFCSGNDKKTILMFSVNIRDASSFIWVDLFGDIGEKFLGVKGEDYENILKNGTTAEENEELIPINERIEYHTFSFIGKVRENIYNDTKRYRFSVFRFTERTPQHKKALTKTLSTLLK